MAILDQTWRLSQVARVAPSNVSELLPAPWPIQKYGISAVSAAHVQPIGIVEEMIERTSRRRRGQLLSLLSLFAMAAPCSFLCNVPQQYVASVKVRS